MRIGILVDSSSQLRSEDVVGTNITVVPLVVIKNNKDEILDIPEEIEKNNIYEAIENNESITTSLVAPGKLEIIYSDLLKTYDHIIHIPISDKLSGMFKTAVTVSNQDEFKTKISVVNSKIDSNAIKHAAFYLSKKINEGITNIDQLLKLLDEYCEKTVIMFMPSDLKRLSKSGRSNSFLVSVLNFLKVQVIVHWKLKPKKIGMARKVSVTISKIVDYVKESKADMSNVVLVHSPKMKDVVKQKLYAALEKEKIKYKYEDISVVFPCHSGINTYGIIFLPKE